MVPNWRRIRAPENGAHVIGQGGKDSPDVGMGGTEGLVNSCEPGRHLSAKICCSFGPRVPRANLLTSGTSILRECLDEPKGLYASYINQALVLFKFLCSARFAHLRIVYKTTLLILGNLCYKLFLETSAPVIRTLWLSYGVHSWS